MFKLSLFKSGGMDMTDNKKISKQPHELAYVLRKYGKSGKKDNIAKMVTILKAFKSGRKDVSRAKFYDYLARDASFKKLK